MFCPICNKELESDESDIDVNLHVNECMDDQIAKQDEIDKGYLELTEIQKKALMYCSKKAKIHQKDTKHIILTRLLDLGYTTDDYIKLSNYVKSVKVTINIHTITLIEKLIDSTTLKNAYELNRGSYRTTKENVIFGKIYTDASAEQKVKYGALNIFKEPNGMKSCHGYGKSVMVVKDKIKKRMTFVNGNSSAQHFYMCTFDNCMPLFVHVADDFIHNIMKIINDEPPIKTNFPYVEAQIHGNVNIDTDIECIFIPKDEHDKYEDKILEFRNAHKNIKINVF